MGLNNRGWDGKNPTINISVYCIQNTEKFSHRSLFYIRGIFLYNSTNFDKKKSKVPYSTHNEIYSTHNEIT